MLANNALRARRRRDHHEERAMVRENEERNDPARLCADTDMHRIVREVVDDLPGDLRVPLLLRCQDELSFASYRNGHAHLGVDGTRTRRSRASTGLRKTLAGRGLAVSLAGLPGLVASQPSPAAPAGLQAKVLGSYSSVPVVAASLTRRAVVAGLAAAAFRRRRVRGQPVRRGTRLFRSRRS
jgi:hypothetical protein